MIDKSVYDLMKEKHGDVASWAVWVPAGDTPGFVFVGLNLSSTHGDGARRGKVPWGNFHSGYRYQNDYKLRFALGGTQYWGSYITDLIKEYPEVDSGKVREYLKANPKVVEKNVESFVKEISHLGESHVLVAIGGDVYDHLKKFLGDRYRIAKIGHYADYQSKEKYREEVLGSLEQY